MNGKVLHKRKAQYTFVNPISHCTEHASTDDSVTILALYTLKNS